MNLELLISYVTTSHNALQTMPTSGLPVSFYNGSLHTNMSCNKCAKNLMLNLSHCADAHTD